MILSRPVANYSLLLTICPNHPEFPHLQPARFELFEENKAEIAKRTEKEATYRTSCVETVLKSINPAIKAGICVDFNPKILK